MKYLRNTKNMKINAGDTHEPNIHFLSIDKEINHYQ